MAGTTRRPRTPQPRLRAGRPPSPTVTRLGLSMLGKGPTLLGGGRSRESRHNLRRASGADREAAGQSRPRGPPSSHHRRTRRYDPRRSRSPGTRIPEHGLRTDMNDSLHEPVSHASPARFLPSVGDPVSSFWRRLVRGTRLIRKQPDWERAAGEGWLERIMTVSATDRLHVK